MTPPAPQTAHTGDNAKVYSGIRDIPIWAGEASAGNKLPGGPYRRPELAAIGLIGLPTIWWVRTHLASGYALQVLLGGVAVTVLVVVALRLLLPNRRPSLSVRAKFIQACLRPPHCVTSSAPAARTRPASATTRTPTNAHRRQL